MINSIFAPHDIFQVDFCNFKPQVIQLPDVLIWQVFLQMA